MSYSGTTRSRVLNIYSNSTNSTPIILGGQAKSGFSESPSFSSSGSLLLLRNDICLPQGIFSGSASPIQIGLTINNIENIATSGSGGTTISYEPQNANTAAFLWTRGGNCTLITSGTLLPASGSDAITWSILHLKD